MSKPYTVDYDLVAPGRDYSALTTALVGLGAKRGMQSKWFLTSASTALQIHDYLWKFMDANDRLFVAELSGDWAGRNLLVDPNKVQNEAALSRRY